MNNKNITQLIYCCNCKENVPARLTDGKEIYPHRRDLYTLPFWKCDHCDGKVGCHHKTKNRTMPLGVIPSHAISKLRGEIHRLIDPVWKMKIKTRKEVYGLMSEHLGYQFHSAEIRSEEEALKCKQIAEKISIQYNY